MLIIAFLIPLFLLAVALIPSYMRNRRNMKLLCSVTSPNRGTSSERWLVLTMLKAGVHPKAIFHDLYLQKRNGEFSQIDIVVAAPQGLLAIEVKDYSGWLFGNEKQRYWTQVLNYGNEKYRFYNPLMQNRGHINALREQSKQLAHLPIFNVVLFAGNCILKDVSYDALNAFVGYTGDIPHVLKMLDSLPLAQYTDKREVARLLRQAVENGSNPDIVANHLAYAQRNAAEKPQPTISSRSVLFRINWRRIMRY